MTAWARNRLLALGVAMLEPGDGRRGLREGFRSLFAARARRGRRRGGLRHHHARASSPTTIRKSRRGRVFAIFFAAIPIGSALGYIVGGLVEQRSGLARGVLRRRRPGPCARPPLRTAVRSAARHPDDADWARRRGRRRLTRDLPRPLQEPPVRARGARLRGLHVRDRRAGLLDAGVPRARSAASSGRRHHPVRGHRRRDRVRGTFAGGYLGDYFLKRSRRRTCWVSGVATLARPLRDRRGPRRRRCPSTTPPSSSPSCCCSPRPAPSTPRS